MEIIALLVEIVIVCVYALFAGIWFILEWLVLGLLLLIIGILWFLGFFLQLVWIGVSDIFLAFLEWVTWRKLVLLVVLIAAIVAFFHSIETSVGLPR